jgi:HSP20 family protein
MALPTTPTDSWLGNLGFPSQLFETGGNDYELYEEDDEFVLSVGMPGFDPEDVTVTWDDGVLNVAAESEDERHNRRRTYHRRFRFPRRVDGEGIVASYNNGILEVRLPAEVDATARGREIPIES